MEGVGENLLFKKISTQSRNRLKVLGVLVRTHLALQRFKPMQIVTSASLLLCHKLIEDSSNLKTIKKIQSCLILQRE